MPREKSPPVTRKDLNRLRAEVHKLQLTRKDANPFTGVVSGNYWTQTGMPWVSGGGRKAVLTEYFWQPIRGQPRRVDTNELRQFSQTFWISACVKTIVDEISSLDWDIVPKEGYEYNWVEEAITEIKNFLKNPNKNNESFQSIERAFIKDVLEIDAGVIIKVFDINSYDFDEIEPKSGAPMLKPLGQRRMTELYARDGASFLKEIDKFGFLKGFWQYSYQIPAHPMWFNRDEVVYISEQPRSMSCYGFARTQSILDIVKSLHYSTLYNKRFFEESAIPDGALSLLDTNETEAEAIRNFWNNEFKSQPHKVAIINKDMKWLPFAVSNRELEFLETQKWYFNVVISMFGLTPAELGITEDLNRATSATQAELVKRKGIRPFLKLFENFINAEIIPEFQYDGVEFQFIYDDPAEKKARLENWKLELDMNVKTPNEVRNEMGLEPIEGGDLTNGQTNQMVRVAASGGSQESGTKEERQAGQSEGYTDTLHREEASNKKKASEIDEEVRDRIHHPYSPNNRPVGNFNSAKPNMAKGAKYKVMSYQELIAEHQKLVQILESGDTSEIRREAAEQKAELEEYMREYTEKGKIQDIHDALVSEGHGKDPWPLAQHIYQTMGKGYVGPVGPYYNEQPISMPRRPTGADHQPQNPKPTSNFPRDNAFQPRRPGFKPGQNQPGDHTDTNPSHLGDTHAVPGKHTWRSDKDTITCPQCGQPTLTVINALEPMPEDIRCTQCGARFNSQELLDAKLVQEITNVLTASNSVLPISIPAMRVKGFTKSMDLDMDVKSYTGIDTTKSFPQSVDYANSPEYRKLMREYLSDFNTEKRNKIIALLKNGLRSAKSIKEISKQINQIIADPERSELIARTEIVRLSNEGNRRRMIEKGTEKVQWISSPEDGRLCNICKALDGQIYDIDKVPNPSDLHPRCRCLFTEYYGEVVL